MTDESARLCIRARTASSSHWMQFRKSSRNLKDPRSSSPPLSPFKHAADIFLPRLSLERHQTLFFIRLFHLHSMFSPFSLLCLALFPCHPFYRPLSSAFQLLYFLQDFSVAPLIRSVSCSSRRYEGSSDFALFRLRDIEYSVGTTHILFVRNLQRGKDPLEKCRPISILNNSILPRINNTGNVQMCTSCVTERN